MDNHLETWRQNESQQVIVRFQNKSHVVTLPLDAIEMELGRCLQEIEKRLICFCSMVSGWPASRLRISSLNLPFCGISVVSDIRGGKGGFGTLLKGQSRQAGAKLTTDFGACRDLQGRRLRHVNDEIKLRKWRDMERRKAAGESVADDELWKTPSGIYNWHLLTPTWADISKKATYRIKRQFQQIEAKEKKKILLKQEREEVYQKSMSHYLETAEAAVETMQHDIPDAIKQGLLAANKNKKRKRSTAWFNDRQAQQDIDSQVPNSLCTLSGDAVVVDRDRSVQLQSKSDFCTAVIVLDYQNISSLQKCPPILYYEVTLLTGGVAQIGWANLIDSDRSFEPNNDLGDGVGDDAVSFAVDASRGLKFHGGAEEPYGKEKWKAGSVLGCLFHCQKGTISFSLDGNDLGEAFSSPFKSLVPAFSCNEGEIIELHTKKEACQYFPDGAIAVSDLIVDEEVANTDSKEAVASLDAKKKTLDDNWDAAGAAKNEKPLVKGKETNSKLKLPSTPKSLDLSQFHSIQELENLGLERLKSALMAIQVKCGGTLAERAKRLFSLRGLQRKDYPKKVRAKGFVE